MKLILVTALALVTPLVAPLALFAQKPEVERPTGGIVDFLQPIEPDSLIQHSKEVFVKNGCAYCHGVDLKVRNGESANLMTSAIVAGDVDGNVIGPLLRHGIPQTAKLSPMPQFSDLSDRNITDLARWIHYSRQQGRYRDITAAPATGGDAAKGKTAFTQNCASCHTSQQIAAIAKQYPAATLRDRAMKPPSLNGVQSYTLAALTDTKTLTARQKHGSLLENTDAASAADLTAYMESLK